MLEDKLLEQAACTGKDTTIFFPVGGSMAVDNSTRYAKAICATCPIIQECLQFALENEEYGIWGGTTETDRKAIKINLRK